MLAKASVTYFTKHDGNGSSNPRGVIVGRAIKKLGCSVCGYDDHAPPPQVGPEGVALIDKDEVESCFSLADPRDYSDLDEWVQEWAWRARWWILIGRSALSKPNAVALSIVKMFGRQVPKAIATSKGKGQKPRFVRPHDPLYGRRNTVDRFFVH
ncbi:MAG: hypothetical protein Q8O98_00250 [bacterium]|nr:hypothetical protein [bacterium]